MADLASVVRAFVAAVISNAAAREAFAAAMHPPDPAKAVDAINAYSGLEPIAVSDFAAIVPLIGQALNDARDGGAKDVPGNIMPGDMGGPAGTIMGGEAGGTTGNIMPGDSGGTTGTIMPGDEEPKP